MRAVLTLGAACGLLLASCGPLAAQEANPPLNRMKAQDFFADRIHQTNIGSMYLVGVINASNLYLDKANCQRPSSYLEIIERLRDFTEQHAEVRRNTLPQLYYAYVKNLCS